MIEEKGVFPIGVWKNNTWRRLKEFSLRPLKVRDSIEASQSPEAERLAGNGELLGLYLLSRRLMIPGLPSEVITLDFMLDLYDQDLAAIMATDERLKTAIESFRGQSRGPEEDGAGADETRIYGDQSNGDELV